jgi:hypothetical protein
MSIKWWEQILLPPGALTVRVDRDVSALAATERANTDLLTYELNGLRQALGEKTVEVDHLRCALSSLTQLLVERGVLDEESVKARFDEAVAELSRDAAPPPEPADATGSPYRDASPAEEEAEEEPPEMVQCQGCGKSVPAARTNVTARGVLCDACFGTAG